MTERLARHLHCATSTGSGRSTAARRSSRTIRTGATMLFYEYFHGDNGAGIGASHQTGWTGLIASLIHFSRPPRRPRPSTSGRPPVAAPAAASGCAGGTPDGGPGRPPPDLNGGDEGLRCWPGSHSSPPLAGDVAMSPRAPPPVARTGLRGRRPRIGPCCRCSLPSTGQRTSTRGRSFSTPTCTRPSRSRWCSGRGTVWYLRNGVDSAGIGRFSWQAGSGSCSPTTSRSTTTTSTRTRRSPDGRRRLLPDCARQRAWAGRVVHLFGPRLHVLGVLRRAPRAPVAQRLIMTPSGARSSARRPTGWDVPLAERDGRPALRGRVLCSRPWRPLNDRPVCRRARPAAVGEARVLASGRAGRCSTEGVVRDELGLRWAASRVPARLPAARQRQRSVARASGRRSISTPVGASRLSGVWFHARTLWGGRYDRNFRAAGDETDGPADGATAAGLGDDGRAGQRFDYRLRDLPRVHDRIASLGLGGPVFELAGAARLACACRSPPSTPSRSSGRWPIATICHRCSARSIKTSLRYSGYYYAHGVVSAATLNVDLGPVGFTGDARGAGTGRSTRAIRLSRSSTVTSCCATLASTCRARCGRAR